MRLLLVSGAFPSHLPAGQNTRARVVSIEIAMNTAEGMDLWTAEQIGGFFPGSRLREIHDAQDVLTDTEKRVYEVFWGSNDLSGDRERIVQKGYDVAAKEARVTKRNLAKIVQRLISKGFLELVAPPVVYRQRTPATYRVIGCVAVREDQKRKGREWVIHTGRGIGYARRLVNHSQQGSPQKLLLPPGLPEATISPSGQESQS